MLLRLYITLNILFDSFNSSLILSPMRLFFNFLNKKYHKRFIEHSIFLLKLALRFNEKTWKIWLQSLHYSSWILPWYEGNFPLQGTYGVRRTVFLCIRWWFFDVSSWRRGGEERLALSFYPLPFIIFLVWRISLT